MTEEQEPKDALTVLYEAREGFVAQRNNLMATQTYQDLIAVSGAIQAVDGLIAQLDGVPPVEELLEALDAVPEEG